MCIRDSHTADEIDLRTILKKREGFFYQRVALLLLGADIHNADSREMCIRDRLGTECFQCDTQFHGSAAVDGYKLVVLQLDDITVNGI